MKKIRLAHEIPYGAWEIKTTYQRNMFYAMAFMISFVIVIIFSFWLASKFIVKPVTETIHEEQIIEISTQFTNKPIVRLDDYSPTSSLRRIAQDLPRLAIPVPVADDVLLEEPEMTIPTKDQRHSLVDNQFGSRAPDDGEPGEFGVSRFGGTGQDTGERPDPEVYQFLHVRPEMITEYQPKYPEIARRLGFEGSVWIQVLIDTEGKVVEAGVFKSSEVDMLDQAALEVAHKNQFSPGIQNDRAVMVWVKYEVKFVLSE